MKLSTVRASAAILVFMSLMALSLAGCSGSHQGAAPETDAQKSKREATIQQHKDAADNVR